MPLKRVGYLLAFPVLLLAAIGLVLRQPVPGPTNTLPAAGADKVRLEKHVRFLSEACHPRDATNLKNLDKAAAYIAAEFKAAKGRVEDQEYSFSEYDSKNKLVRRGPYRNVIARFGPAGDDRVVVGAHYDAYGQLPGADDNASGLAGLLELARLLGQNRPAVTVELVAYTLEEPPYFDSAYMGSLHHAAELFKQEVRVRAMIALETIGYFSSEPASQAFPMPLLKLYYPTTGDFVAVVGGLRDALLCRRVKKAMRSASALPVYSISAPAKIPGVDFSDHRSYWKFGYPAVMISDTAFYRNKRYHTPEDKPATLDYGRMASVVDGVYAAVHSFK